MKLLIVMLTTALLAACASTGSGTAPERTAALSAPAQASGEETAAAPATHADDPGYWDEIICKRADTTGTRLYSHRCHSRYDWARMSGAAREIMRDIESQPIPCLKGDDC